MPGTPKRTVMTPTDWNRAERMAMDGVPYKEIAGHLGVSHGVAV